MTSKPKDDHESRPKPPPATTPEARELQMISLAFDQAELQMRQGTAPAPVIVHYLKLATIKEQREREKLEQEVRLLKKRVSEIDMAQEMKGLMEDARRAMTEYKGQDLEEDDEYD